MKLSAKTHIVKGYLVYSQFTKPAIPLQLLLGRLACKICMHPPSLGMNRINHSLGASFVRNMSNLGIIKSHRINHFSNVKVIFLKHPRLKFFIKEYAAEF